DLSRMRCCRFRQMGRHRPVEQRKNHEVEHYRDNNLVGAESGLQPAGYQANGTSAHSGRGDQERGGDEQWQATRQQGAEHSGGEPSGGKLTLGADVEQPGACGDGKRQPCTRECRGPVNHLSETVRIAPGAFEQQSIYEPWGLSEYKDQQVADDEGEDYRDERRQQRLFQPLATRCAPGVGEYVGVGQLGCSGGHDSLRATPVMCCPRRSAVASATGSMQTRRPPSRTPTRSDSVRISFRSAETRRTAFPAARAARSRSWMNSIAPTSTPRVGCAA